MEDKMERRHFFQACLGGLASAVFFSLTGKKESLIEGLEKKGGKTDVVVKVLGTAQDGGIPQMGCYCRNCLRARKDKRFARLVSSLAILDMSEKKLFIIDASPGLPAQFDSALKRMALARQGLKNSPDAVLLTHAHVGHYTGLIYFGYEVMSSHRLPVYCTSRMASFLRENGPWSQLVNLENISLNILSYDQEFSLSPHITVTPFSVPHRDEYSDTLGFAISGRIKKLLYIPDIQSWQSWERSIEEETKKFNYALLDGTFYSPEELPGRDISKIGHPLIKTSLEILKDVAREGRTEVYFTHLNHTNSALDPEGEAKKEVEENGFKIASEGMEFYL
jgi:pyrroloquinoline quinone biosynthesis protein B